ncbi:MAG: cation transporter, partial [Clostridia bacterium]|nr:cation transporter [Clostridia bacterium]
GVEKCSVSLLTNTMTISGEYDEEELKEEIRKAGYEVLEFSESKDSFDQNNSQTDTETKILKKSLRATTSMRLTNF